MIDPEPAFARVRRGAEIPRGQSRAVRAGRYDVAIFNVDGEFYALENNCPHQGGPIAEGWLEDNVISCPWHGWCFDVRTGKMTLGEFAHIRRFVVHRDGADLLVSREPLPEDLG